MGELESGHLLWELFGRWPLEEAASGGAVVDGRAAAWAGAEGAVSGV